MPYIISALDFRWNSAGIRVLHKLCKMINNLGGEAYVNVPITAPGVPTLYGQREKLRQMVVNGAICVYPESMKENYLWSKNPVGWLLYYGEFEFEREGLLFTYDKIHRDVETLTILDIEPFFCDDKNYKRTFNAIYAVKGWSPEIIKDMPNKIMIGSNYPKTRKKLADLLKRSKCLHLFRSSNISAEARLCGCPVLFHENDVDGKQNTMEAMKDTYASTRGMANSVEGLEQASAELPEYQKLWHAQDEKNESEVIKFMKITQKWVEEKKHATCKDCLVNY